MQCSFCGGELEERRVQHEYRWEGRLVVFEDVPARVCRQCGEKYFDAQVVKAMERVVLHQLEPQRILQVPLFVYPEIAPVEG
ncbi:MAG: type II toxin-antitoxin system MqsA family antitoxin [Anaerolineae bacterium]